MQKIQIYICKCSKTNLKNAQLQQIYAPVTAVKFIEVQTKPGFTKFLLDPQDNVVFPLENHLNELERCSPINIMEGISSQLCTAPPNMIGVHYICFFLVFTLQKPEYWSIPVKIVVVDSYPIRTR